MLNFYLKRSSVANKRPTAGQILSGEIALNTNSSDPGMFLKADDNSISKVGPVSVSGSPPNSTPSGSLGNFPGEYWMSVGASPRLSVYSGSEWATFPNSSQVLPFDNLYSSTGSLVSPRHIWGMMNLYTNPTYGQVPFTCTTSNSTTNPGCNLAGGGGGSAARCNMTTYNINAVENYTLCYQFLDQVTYQRTLISSLDNGATLGLKGSTIGVNGSGRWWRVGSLFAPCCYSDLSTRGWKDAVGGGTSGTNFWVACHFGLNGTAENSRRFFTFTSSTSNTWANGGAGLDIYAISGTIRFYRNIGGTTIFRSSSPVSFNTGANNDNIVLVYDDGNILQYSVNGSAWTSFLESGSSNNSNYIDTRFFLGTREILSSPINNFGNNNPIAACAYYVGDNAGMPSQSSLLAAGNAIRAMVQT